MTLKQKLIAAYAGVAVLFALYASHFGPTQYRGFAYNLGRGLVWPVTIFPTLGTIISAIVIIGFVVLVTVFGDAQDS